MAHTHRVNDQFAPDFTYEEVKVLKEIAAAFIAEREEKSKQPAEDSSKSDG